MNKTLVEVRKCIPLYVLLLPAIVLVICFAYVPMYGVIIAFKDYSPARGIMNSAWAGLKHFNRFFNSFQFGAIMRNTLGISFYSLAVGFPLPIIFALFINQMKAGLFKRFFQTVTYMPHFISTVVMVGLLILLLSPSSGIFGSICRALGFTAPNLMANAGAFSSVYVWSDVWQHLGWDSIIYIAALSSVDPTLYEAATIDGASRWHKLIHIDFPMILPTAGILLIMRLGSVLGVGFEKVYLMQNTLNLDTSEVIATYVYKMGLLSSQYSFSAAVGLFNTLVNFVLLVIVNRVSSKISDNTLF
ncbi:MAG: ABC transporter permease subunit [Treponema sp.]|jgi:putative aldouronate transport system permease protein|nr:ABC transporter permease subunit [Treponema sp.]